MKNQSMNVRLSVFAGALMLAGATHANLVTNPGFETGDFSGWTQFGNTSNSGATTFSPHTGTYTAVFGPSGSTGGILQMIATTPGATYNVDFWLFNLDEPANSFAFNWDGGTAETTLTDAPPFNYTHFVYSLMASTAATELSFTFQHDPSIWLLDDISVTQVNTQAIPEPSSLALVVLAGAMAAVVYRRRSA